MVKVAFGILCYLPMNTAGISGLDNLQSLDVSGNQLHTLTPAIGQLTCLASLRLGNNELNHLPTGVCFVLCVPIAKLMVYTVW